MATYSSILHENPRGLRGPHGGLQSMGCKQSDINELITHTHIIFIITKLEGMC